MSKFFYILLCIVSSKLTAGEGIIFDEKIHTDSVDSLCLKGEAIISGSFDGTIVETINTESNITGKHNDWVRKVLCIDSVIVSASNDGNIALWENNDGKIKTIKAHNWWITDLVYTNRKLISVSLDENIKIWSYPDLKLIFGQKLFGSNKLFSVHVASDKIFIGATKGILFIMESDSKRLKTFRLQNEPESVIMSIISDQESLYFGSSKGIIYKMPLKNLKAYEKLKVSDSAIKALLYNNGILFSGSDDGYIRKIDVKSFRYISDVSYQDESVRSLMIDSNYLYAGYDDGYIRAYLVSK